jgi:hypothetical protein
MRALPLDRLPQPRLVHPVPVAGEGETEAFAVVEAEVIAVVRLAVQRIAVLREGGDQRVAVLRLIPLRHAGCHAPGARGAGTGYP